MQTRKLGRSNLQIAPLVFGGNVLGWTADEAMSFRLLDAFVGAGFNLIDTADIHAGRRDMPAASPSRSSGAG